MVTQTDPFKAVPRITRDHFAQVIRANGNPDLATERDPGEYWDAIKGYGIDPLFLLGMFNHESNLGMNGTATQTRSWGNTRAPSFGIDYTPPLIAGRSGEFPVFRTWLDGCITTAARLVEPSWVYANRTSMADIFLFDGPVWAPAGDLNDPGGYLRSVLDFMNANADGSAPPAPAPTPQPGGTLNIVDLRSQLYRNPNGGPNASATARTGIVVHYNGPPPNPDAVTQYTNDAVYHANKDWGQGNYGDGIMYHWGIGGDGTAYQLRDEDAALWHCGTNENYTALSINVNIGDGEHATPQQIVTLTLLCDGKRKQYGIPLERTFGHQELSPTSCPGTLMADFIYPYRDGTIGGTAVTTAFKDPVTGKLVANGMLDFFTANGGVAVLGRPVTNEVQEEWPDDPNGSPKRTVQCFERDVLAFFPENKDPYRVQALRLGAKWAQQRGYQGPGIDPPPKPLPNPMGEKGIK